jgi:predicted dinucleotide-binding enzyme
MNKSLPRFRRRGILLVVTATAALCALPLADAFAQGAAAKPKIGMIGSGNVGSNLGRAWVGAGYEVMFSSKDIEADRKLAADIGGKARAGTPQEAGAFGEVLVFAVPYGAQPELGKTLGKSLIGKVAIDASNPFPQRDGEIATEAREKGAGIVSARLLPGARIVRAFNAIPAARMSVGHEAPGKVGVPIAGDDAKAIEIASKMIRDIGFEPVLVGGAAMGKHLVPGTPLAGEHTPAELRTIAATLKP